MEVSDIIAKIKQIELKSRLLSENIFSGEYHTAFKGRGMTFSEVRQYQFGDDIRAIDWNVTARYNTPFVKVFRERERDDRFAKRKGSFQPRGGGGNIRSSNNRDNKNRGPQQKFNKKRFK